MLRRFPTVCVATTGLLLLLSACDKSKDEGKGEAENKDKAEVAGGEEGAAEAGEKVAKVEKELSDEARFDKEMGKKGCDLLTAKMVADTFGVPEAEVEQFKMMGCIYNWKGDDEIVEANITLLRAHKSEKAAAKWITNATRSQTKEEISAQLEKVREGVKDSDEVNTKLEEKTADQLMDVANDMLPDEGVSYEDVDGVGDEARVNVGDGTIWVRVDNLTFNVVGYKGPPQKELDLSPADMKDLKKVTAMAKEAQQAWLAEVADDRRAGGEKLGKVIVENLENLE